MTDNELRELAEDAAERGIETIGITPQRLVALLTENRHLKACVRSAIATQQNPDWDAGEKLAFILRELASVSGRQDP